MPRMADFCPHRRYESAHIGHLATGLMHRLVEQPLFTVFKTADYSTGCYVTPGHSYYYGPAPGYYFGSSDYNRRYYPPPRDYYRDRDRDYGPRYYRDRERNRYYDPLDGRRYRQERYTPRYREDRYRRDTYKEHRIPKEGRTIQERRLPR